MRENLAFSKSLNNHVLAIEFFICHYKFGMSKKKLEGSPNCVILPKISIKEEKIKIPIKEKTNFAFQKFKSQ